MNSITSFVSYLSISIVAKHGLLNLLSNAVILVIIELDFCTSTGDEMIPESLNL